jgi:hypothetical protein
MYTGSSVICASSDLEGLKAFEASDTPTLLVYIWTIRLENPHYSKRHADFIKQSLVDGTNSWERSQNQTCS